MSRRGSSVQKEKLLGQSQWKDYSGATHPPPQNNYAYDAFESDDPKGWQQNASRHSYDRHSRGNTHSLPRGGHGGHHPPPHAAYPMGYSSFDRRAGGFTSRPPGPADFPPRHYFMPSQRKYSGEVLRVPGK
eukprot:TRINITY_DN17319_c0_g1_i1.p1 TRINITY_DN17319_c0_g1~~TRINITY_DN17319_c0_g1_i1.p1  ORF type:complete len:141 (-),score=12.29 TRINITY_DN17319_c0_g1_i1:149-541(-)